MKPLPSFMVLFFAVTTSTSVSESDATADAIATHKLSPGVPQLVSIPMRGSIRFDVDEIQSTSSFLVVQIHTQYVNLTLATSTNVSLSGSSMGMVRMLSLGETSATWTAQLANGVIVDDNVTALVLVQEYQELVPVPGGCNQVFSLEVDPNILVAPSDYTTQVWFQWASVGVHRGQPIDSCEEKAATQRLKYDVYVAYVPDSDDGGSSMFEVLRSLGTPEMMRSNAVKIMSIDNDGLQKSRTIVTSQRRQGAVYGVVVTDDVKGLTATYVAAVTFACNFTNGDCGYEYGAVEWTSVVACLLFGFFLLAVGHLHIKTEMFVVGFITVGLVCTIVLFATSLSADTNFAISMVIGLFGGVVWWVVWVVFRFPSVSVLLPGLCAGFLVAGTLFSTPFANISWWQSDLNYGLVFTCATLLYAVPMLCKPRTLNIVSCALIGGYCLVTPAAIFLHSSLTLIVLNVMRHVFVPGYSSVHIVFPFQLKEILTAVAWGVLVVAAAMWQFYRSWGKPPFPDQRRQRPRNIQDGVAPPSPDDDDDENAPLLGNRDGLPSYREAVNHGARHPAELNPVL